MTVEVVVRDDLPAPPSGRVSPYIPWKDMEVGQCAEVIGEEDPARIAVNLRNLAANYKRRHGMTFTVRVVDDVVRVWRTA